MNSHIHSYPIQQLTCLIVKRITDESVFFLFGALLTLAAPVYGDEWPPADSLKVSKDVSLDEVVVTATKAVKGTPVAYSNLSKDELTSRNDGQGIPALIATSPSVIVTSDAGTGIGYSGFSHPRNRCQSY